MGDPNASVDVTPIPSFCRKAAFMRTYQDIDSAIRRDDELFLRRHLKEVAEKKAKILQMSQKLKGQYYSAVNLSGDSLLSVLISYEKTKLVKKLLKYVDGEYLLEANLQRNTALHVAAAVGDKVMDVADELITKNKELLNMRNEDGETPLLKAALHGQRKIFWRLYKLGDCNAAMIKVKRTDGANVLHCAIMGNAPRLALEIADRYQDLRTTRNIQAVTPLQLLVTIAGAFGSKLEMGPLESFIYNCIPHLDDGDEGDRAASSAVEVAYDPHMPAAENQDDEENPQLLRRKSFPPNYATMFNLFKLTKIPAGWVKRLIFGILKQVFPKVKDMENQKKHHMETMKLIECLAGDDDYWDFIGKGKTGQFDESRNFYTPEREMKAKQLLLSLLMLLLQKIESSEQRKKHNMETMALIDSLAGNVKYWDFIGKAKTGQFDESRNFYSPDEEKLCIMEDDNDLESSNDGIQRWNDSPLIIGVKMGLHEFVDKILEV